MKVMIFFYLYGIYGLMVELVKRLIGRGRGEVEVWVIYKGILLYKFFLSDSRFYYFMLCLGYYLIYCWNRRLCRIIKLEFRIIWILKIFFYCFVLKLK